MLLVAALHAIPPGVLRRLPALDEPDKLPAASESPAAYSANMPPVARSLLIQSVMRADVLLPRRL